MNHKTYQILGIVFTLFCIAQAVLVAVFFQQTQRYALHEGEKQIENLLLTHKALHTYIENVQKPEIYRLKDVCVKQSPI